jgi:hypothetical protein
MKTFASILLSSAVLLLVTREVRAANRVQAGEWETKATMAGKPTVSKHCITADEARLMNGDEATLRKYVEQSTAEKTRGRCAVKSVSVSDNKTVVTIACGTISVTATTIYHGDHYESTSSNGTTLVGKRIGACP